MKVKEVSEFFLSKEGMTNKKVKKLCYYAQAWFYALYNKKLFDKRIEAWVHGSVCPQLYKEYAEFGYQEKPKINKKIEMQENEKNVLEQVWEIYGELDGDKLEVLTYNFPTQFRSISDFITSKNSFLAVFYFLRKFTVILTKHVIILIIYIIKIIAKEVSINGKNKWYMVDYK